MNIQLLLFLVIFTIAIWVIYNKDIMAPSVVLGGIFSLVIYLSLFMDARWDFDIGKDTCIILETGILFFAFGSLVMRFLYALSKSNPYSFLKSEFQYIEIWNREVLFLITFIIFIISAISIIAFARSIAGSSGISELIYAYRISVLSGTNKLSHIVANLILVNYAIGYCLIYIIINNYFCTNIIDKKLLLQVAFPFIIGNLQGARGNGIQYLSFTVVLYSYFYLIKRNIRNINPKLLSKIIVVMFGAMYGFYKIKFFLGREDHGNAFFNYIGGLFCAPVKIFDLYIKENHSRSAIWGMETLTNLIGTIRRLQNRPGIIYRDYANYRVINGLHLGNVYTAFRAYYADFGMIGVMICPFLIGIMIGFFYENLRRKASVRGINLGLFFYAYAFYGVAMMFYSNTILEYLCNVSFLKIIVVWLFFYHIFIKGKYKIIIRH